MGSKPKIKVEGEVFFTSDHHFHHHNIIDLVNRPFTDIYDMNHEMIKRWNQVVSPLDSVFHLGDMFWHSRVDDNDLILNQLHGQISFIRGNHDEGAYRVRDRFERFVDYLEVETCSKIFVLSHYPMLTWNYRDYGSIQLHGHVHGTLDDEVEERNYTKRIDVGVDSWDFYPVSVEQVIKEVNQRNTY